MSSERLQKILAAAGIASRRKSEELISGGRVTVNGEIVTELGTKADPRTDEIRLDGELLRGPERHVYIMVYKPKGHVTTVSDPEGRPTVMELISGVKERVFPVGRLDYMSEGLLLMTNDGDLMAQLTKAGSHVPKTYQVKVSGQPTEEDIQKLRDGIVLPPEPGMTGARGPKQPGVERRSFRVRTQPARIELTVNQENPWYSVTLIEGRNRQIRRMFEQIGHHVEKIKRVQYGPLELDVEPGQWRALSPKEVTLLRSSIGKKFDPERPVRGERKGARGERGGAVRGDWRDAARKVMGDYRREERGGRRRPEGRSEERGERGFERQDRGERSGERPAARGGERREWKPRRTEGQEGSFERPRRERPSFDRDRGPRRERPEGFDRGPRRERGEGFERPQRREGGFGRPRQEGGSERPRREFAGDRESRGPARGGERREWKPRREGEGGRGGERKNFGERKPFGDRGERKSFGDRRPSADRGERKSFGDREGFRERKPFGDRKPFADRGERKSFGDRPQGGERKSFGDRKPFGTRSFDGPPRERTERRGPGGPKGFGSKGPGRKPAGDRGRGGEFRGNRGPRRPRP